MVLAIVQESHPPLQLEYKRADGPAPSQKASSLHINQRIEREREKNLLNSCNFRHFCCTKLPGVKYSLQNCKTFRYNTKQISQPHSPKMQFSKLLTASLFFLILAITASTQTSTYPQNSVTKTLTALELQQLVVANKNISNNEVSNQKKSKALQTIVVFLLVIISTDPSFIRFFVLPHVQTWFIPNATKYVKTAPLYHGMDNCTVDPDYEEDKNITFLIALLTLLAQREKLQQLTPRNDVVVTLMTLLDSLISDSCEYVSPRMQLFEESVRYREACM